MSEPTLDSSEPALKPYDPVSLATDVGERRRFLKAMTAAGLGASALILLNPVEAEARRGLRPPTRPDPTPPPAGFPGDVEAAFPGIPGMGNIKVLNFALTLEILEADLYRQALNIATGRPIDAPLAANPNVYTPIVGRGGLRPAAARAGFRYLRDYAFVEAAHRDFLIAAISAAGATPAQPNPGGYRFPARPSPTISALLRSILPLEETGVRAYLGAAPFLTDLGLVQTATSIYSTECRHSAVVGAVLNLDPGPRKMVGDRQVVADQPAENTFEYFLEPAEVIRRIQPFFA